VFDLAATQFYLNKVTTSITFIFNQSLDLGGLIVFIKCFSCSSSVVDRSQKDRSSLKWTLFDPVSSPEFWFSGDI